jgi:peptidoglycan/LPS O-acetylase OafA/YrhL
MISSRRLPELDGIRALAILAVLATHFFATDATAQAGGALHGVAKTLYLVAGHGWLGVDLFFVLSGFLITGILLDTREKATYFRDFWLRRALRILPLVFTVVTILAVIYRPHWLYVLMAFFFSVDLAQLFGLGNRAMGPMWSLAVEEQFYLLWPFLVLWLPRRVFAWVTLAVIIAEPLLRMTFQGALDLPWFRVDGLAMGAFIAVWARSTAFSPRATLYACAAALVLASLLLFAELHAHVQTFGLRITEADLIFGALVAATLALPGHRLFAPLRSRTARFVAETSFCVYLIHIPLFDLVQHLGVGKGAANPFAAVALQAALAIPLTFGLAALSRTYLELPFQRLKNRFAPNTSPAPSTERASEYDLEDRPRSVAMGPLQASAGAHYHARQHSEC